MSNHKNVRVSGASTDTHGIRFTISPTFIAKGLFAITFLLVIAHLVFSINHHHLGYNVFGATQLYVMFDLMGEVTIPTWYSSSLMLLASILLASIAAVKRRRGDRFQRHWWGLALLMLGMSMDEAADLHGAVSYKLQSTLNTSGFLAYPWVIVGAVLTVVVGLIYLRFLFQIDPAIRRLFLVSGSVFIGGALVMEMIEAAYDSAYGNGTKVPYILMVAIEEGMEMGAIIILITGLLIYLGSLSQGLHIDIATDRGSVDLSD